MRIRPLDRLLVSLGVALLVGCGADPGPDAAETPAAPPSLGGALTGDQQALVALLAGMVREPDDYAKALRLGALLPLLGPDAAPALEATLRDASLDIDGSSDMLVRRWAEFQPAEATRWAVEQCPPAYRMGSVITALSIWASQDPQAALAATLEWEKYRADVVEVLKIGMMRGWYAYDRDQAAEFIAELPPGIARQRFVGTFLRTLIQQEGADAAMRWAESVPDADQTYKLAVYRQTAAALPLFDFDASIRWCDAHCEGPFGNSLRSIIGRRWAVQDGPSAMEWLRGAPEGVEAEETVRAVFLVWAQADRREALDWVATQPGVADGEMEPWLRPIIAMYVRALSVDDSAAALRWAEQIENDEEREIVMVSVSRRWLQVDRDAAEAWLAESPLSEEAREQARDPNAGHRQPFL